MCLSLNAGRREYKETQESGKEKKKWCLWGMHATHPKLYSNSGNKGVVSLVACLAVVECL